MYSFAPIAFGLDLASTSSDLKRPTLLPALGKERGRVAALDYGVKGSIHKELRSRGASVVAMPASTSAKEILAANPDGRTGQRVRLEEAPVQARLGEHAFWMELPGGVPYLVRMTPELVERAMVVNQGDKVNITGQVHQMTDSVIADWEANGVLQTEGERMQAEFATTFLEASRVRVTVPAGN
jgi:hypothetical protein